MKGPEMNVPTGVSVAVALLTFFLFRTGHTALAWCVIAGGGLILGIVYGRKTRK